MKSQLGPVWNRRSIDAGQKWRKMWEAHFRKKQPTEQLPIAEGSEEHQKLENVRAKYEADLVRKPNVVAVAVGIRTKGGRPTGQPCLVVYVRGKRPKSELGKQDLIPSEIEGVPVDVVEAGSIDALPR